MTPVSSTDGVIVALHDPGGSGRPVLFAHATGFCGRMPAPVVAHLSAGRLQRFDGLGHFGPCEAPARLASSIVAAFGECAL